MSWICYHLYWHICWRSPDSVSQWLLGCCYSCSYQFSFSLQDLLLILSSACVCVCMCVYMCMCAWLYACIYKQVICVCVCVCVCVSDRERERQGISCSAIILFCLSLLWLHSVVSVKFIYSSLCFSIFMKRYKIVFKCILLILMLDKCLKVDLLACLI